jgi:hypothetical protein
VSDFNKSNFNKKSEGAIDLGIRQAIDDGNEILDEKCKVLSETYQIPNKIIQAIGNGESEVKIIIVREHYNEKILSRLVQMVELEGMASAFSQPTYCCANPSPELEDQNWCIRHNARYSEREKDFRTAYYCNNNDGWKARECYFVTRCYTCERGFESTDAVFSVDLREIK